VKSRKIRILSVEILSFSSASLRNIWYIPSVVMNNGVMKISLVHLDLKNTTRHIIIAKKD